MCTKTLLAGALVLLLAACGVVKTIPESHLVKEIPPQRATPEGTAIVAVRWPLAVTEDGWGLIQEMYEEKMHTSSLHPFVADAYRRIPEASTYYALVLYAFLKAYLPPNSVLLEPYVIGVDADGAQLRYQPVFDNLVPAPFAVDVVEPPQWMTGAHGQYLWTMFRASVNPQASPATCGLLASSDFRWTNSSKDNSKVIVDDDCRSALSRSAPRHTVLDFFSRKTPKFTEEFPHHEEPVLRPNSVLVFPFGGFALPEEYVRRSARTKFVAKTDAPENDWLANVARLVAHAAAKWDLESLTRSDRMLYEAQFDKSITQEPASALRQQAIRKLAEAEKKWIAAQDEKIAEALLNGKFGKSFRQRRVADMGVNQRAFGNSMARATRMFSAGVSSGLFGAPGAYNPMMLAQGVSAELRSAAEMSHALQAQVKAELGPEAAVRDQIIQVEIAGLARQINADSRLKLRQQLVQLYAERFGVNR